MRLKTAKKMLQFAKAKILGFLYNDAATEGKGYGKYYGKYYGR